MPSAIARCTATWQGALPWLADVFKRDVYAVSRYINDARERREVIPEGSLTKAPSAELAPDQFDQDTLPPYPVLDAILEGLIRARGVSDHFEPAVSPGNGALGCQPSRPQ